jgi:hypothetical protein
MNLSVILLLVLIGPVPSSFPAQVIVDQLD